MCVRATEFHDDTKHNVVLSKRVRAVVKKEEAIQYLFEGPPQRRSAHVVDSTRTNHAGAQPVLTHAASLTCAAELSTPQHCCLRACLALTTAASSRQDMDQMADYERQRGTRGGAHRAATPQQDEVETSPSAHQPRCEGTTIAQYISGA